MKQIVYYFFRFCNLFLETTEFFFRMVFFENFKNYISKSRKLQKLESNEMVLLANGPSLNEVLSRIQSDEIFKEKDFCVVNYIADADVYEKIMPKYYVLSDPQFFQEDHKSYYKAKALYEHMQRKTTWKMNLYVQYCYYKLIDWKIVLNNENIKVIPFHSTLYNGFESIRFPLYKRGLGNGEFGTVIQNAIYISITLGYKKLHLYGVDHNFFDGLTVNNNNQLCHEYAHYYDKSKTELKPVTISDGEALKTYEFLEWYAKLFKGHHVLNRYAVYMGCQIINHTPNSLIDAYERG